MGYPLGAHLTRRRLSLSAHGQEGFHDALEVVARSADGASIPLQVDGDYIGDVVEARFDLAPGALTVVS